MNQDNSLFSLDGKVVVVTGGTKRYGLCMAEGLAEAGATVILTSRDKARAEEVAHPLRERGLDAHGAQLQQGDDASIEAFVGGIIAEYGRIDVLVNSARHIPGMTAFEIDRAELDKTFTVNATGQILLTRRVIEAMRSTGGGNIINIGSIYGMGGQDPRVYDDPDRNISFDYAIMKGGMIAWTKQLATVLAKDNIRCNCLSLGGFKEPTSLPAGLEERYCERTPMGRMANTNDVKGPIVFLASNASGYMTGANLVVDGGWTAW